jgi:hypothetical protein
MGQGTQPLADAVDEGHVDALGAGANGFLSRLADDPTHGTGDTVTATQEQLCAISIG